MSDKTSSDFHSIRSITEPAVTEIFRNASYSCVSCTQVELRPGSVYVYMLLLLDPSATGQDVFNVFVAAVSIDNSTLQLLRELILTAIRVGGE
ncbi:hypothetical protein NDU88_007591 [Pleurodeles waltl]|uniref:Uncharacterized protein n=2 Tax=Pleurodeles waltl TaxID=8319 RepID=A0AAV7ST40_PLEWA|nr:hypothetical protein NDU88_007591 [Pleurodeles waltl]